MARTLWLYTVAAVWLTAGLFVEGWAHSHRRLDLPLFGAGGSPAFSPPSVPATLTAWHLPVLLGMLAVAVWTVVRMVQLRSWKSSSTGPHYADAAWGAALYAAGIATQLLFPHLPVVQSPDLAPGLPRFESLPSLLGPSSLLRAAGLLLIVSAPLRAGARPGGQETWTGRAWLPVVLSGACTMAVLAYLTQFAHPMVDLWPEISFWRRGLQTYRYSQFYFGESMGMLSIIVQTMVMMGVVLLLLRRPRLPSGSLTLLFTIQAGFISVLQDRYLFIASAAAAGVIADRLRTRLGPIPAAWEVRLFAFVVPAVYVALYFLALAADTGLQVPLGPVTQRLEGIGWSMQLRVGAALTAGAVGLLLSYLTTDTAAGRA